MADNPRLPATGAGTADIAPRTEEKSAGVHTQIVGIDLGGAGTESLLTDSNPMPVKGYVTFTAITFSLDTNAYADGDVLADTQVLSACLRVNDGTGIIQDVVFNDKDDQGEAFDVVIFNANTSLGTENSGPNISDANGDTIQGLFTVFTTDWHDLGGIKVANIPNVGIEVKGASGTDDIYVGLVSRGDGTYSASGITAIFKILCD